MLGLLSFCHDFTKSTIFFIAKRAFEISWFSRFPLTLSTVDLKVLLKKINY